MTRRRSSGVGCRICSWFFAVCMVSFSLYVNIVVDEDQAIMKSASLCDPLPPNTKVVRVLGYDMVVHATGDVMSEHLTNRGFWEVKRLRDILELAPNTPRPPTGRVVYDIGANLGYYSLLFAKIGYNVVAVEPLPVNIQAFRATLCRNPSLRNRITLHEAAIAKKTDAACRLVARAPASKVNYTLGVAKLYCGSEIKQHHECREPNVRICEPVPTMTLDDIMIDEPTAILKIDIEGLEKDALESGTRLLETHPPELIQFEHKKQLASDKNNLPIVGLLREYGYQVGTKRGHDGNLVAKRIVS